MKTPGAQSVVAIIPAEDAGSLRRRAPRLRAVVVGDLCAVTGPAEGKPEDASAALRHDRVMRRVMEACSAIIPFRLGVTARSDAALTRLLSRSAEALTSELARLRDRAEMGLKVWLAPMAERSLDQEIERLSPELGRIRALAPRASDRKEQIQRAQGGLRLTGCYLVPRASVDAFWDAVDELRRAAPGAPVLGTGPWAPYSFCDVQLSWGAEDDDARGRLFAEAPFASRARVPS